MAGPLRIPNRLLAGSAMTEKLWYLKRCFLFEKLDHADLRSVELAGKAKTFARGEPIYLPAEHAQTVFLLAEGRAKICHLTPDGKQSILAFIDPGEIFGELALLDAEQRDEYAEAVEKSTVVLIPAETIHSLIEKHPAVSLGVTKLFGLRRRRVERRLKNLLFLSNRERLTHLLLELAEQYGIQTKEGVRLGIPLSHQDLANVIGSTRETVTVVLGELQNEGLVTVGRKKILIKDPAKLAAGVQVAAPELPARVGV